MTTGTGTGIPGHSERRAVDVSIVIPTLNGGDDLRRCLEQIAAQDFSGRHEVVVVDSGSSDGSASLARSLGAVVCEIARNEFNHGRARNMGAAIARGEMLVFTSQDACPDDDHWLSALVTPLRRDSGLAGVYGRQLPHADARPAQRYFLDFLYGSEPREQSADGPAELSMETTLFSNVNSAMPRGLWGRFPFAEDIVMSEDQEWSARVLLAGLRLRYVPEARVRHSHIYTLRSAFRRFFDSGASASRAYLAGAGEADRVLRRKAFAYGRGEVAWLIRNRQLASLPYTAVYELTKFAGLQLGTHHRWLAPGLKRRFSALPGYWT
jgi:rhamnosyltransferase